MEEVSILLPKREWHWRNAFRPSCPGLTRSFMQWKDECLIGEADRTWHQITDISWSLFWVLQSRLTSFSLMNMQADIKTVHSLSVTWSEAENTTWSGPRNWLRETALETHVHHSISPSLSLSVSLSLCLSTYLSNKSQVAHDSPSMHLSAKLNFPHR